MDPFNRPIDKAVWGKHRFWVSGRLPQIFMVANHFPPCPKMKIFAMTRVVSNISGMPDILETLLSSPRIFTIFTKMKKRE